MHICLLLLSRRASQAAGCSSHTVIQRSHLLLPGVLHSPDLWSPLHFSEGERIAENHVLLDFLSLKGTLILAWHTMGVWRGRGGLSQSPGDIWLGRKLESRRGGGGKEGQGEDRAARSPGVGRGDVKRRSEGGEEGQVSTSPHHHHHHHQLCINLFSQPIPSAGPCWVPPGNRQVKPTT